MLLHELATGAADLGAYRFVAVGKTVDLHKSLLSIVGKKSFPLLCCLHMSCSNEATNLVTHALLQEAMELAAHSLLCKSQSGWCSGFLQEATELVMQEFSCKG